MVFMKALRTTPEDFDVDFLMVHDKYKDSHFRDVSAMESQEDSDIRYASFREDFKTNYTKKKAENVAVSIYQSARYPEHYAKSKNLQKFNLHTNVSFEQPQKQNN